MKAIKDFDNVQPAGSGIDNLPAGGYVCHIKKCTEEKNRTGSGSHLLIQFDVCEGDYRNFFLADYKNQTREDKFWRGVIRQNVPDETSPKYDLQCRFFRSFINAVEESNDGYHWDWKEAGLKGLFIGVIFGEVEKESQRGTRYMVTRADSIVSANVIREGKYQTPAPKLLQASAAAPSFSAADNSDDGEGFPF